MTCYQRLLPLLLSVCGCFSEPPPAPGTSDADVAADSTSDGTSSGESAGPGPSASASDTSGPSGGTPGSGSESGDASAPGSGPGTTADTAEASDAATLTESGYDATAESSGTRGDESSGLAPYGSPCMFQHECEGGVCLRGEELPDGMCSVGCDPGAGACPAVGHSAFCVEVTSGFACFGELDTGLELEDGLLEVGDSLSASVGGGDIDAFVLEHPQSGNYSVRVDPQSGLDVMIRIYEGATYSTAWNTAGLGGVENYGYTVSGAGVQYPYYLTAVVSAVNGTSGNYEVSLIAG